MCLLILMRLLIDLHLQTLKLIHLLILTLKLIDLSLLMRLLIGLHLQMLKLIHLSLLMR